MSTYCVTGAAGFIGSHLCEALLAEGHRVVGLDGFIPYYPRAAKETNLSGLRGHDRFTFIETELRTDPLHDFVAGCDAVFHLAAMPGLMKSWSDFQLYSSCNLEATQRLLDAVRDRKIPHFLHVSTSSVYGREATGPETSELQPFSPYGITKLAAEGLCHAYHANFGVPFTILRYFSVYGPRQRPDMAYHLLIEALLSGNSFPLHGDGEQTRSNTFVSDCVRATMLAAAKPEAALGRTFNIGGGEVVSLNQVIALLEALTGSTARIERKPPRPGDQKHTQADITQARERLGYEPTVGVREGLTAQVAWHSQIRATAT
jgi:nucleoside-diphosphate-sugar epimerase